MRISDWSSDVCSSDLPMIGASGAISAVMGTYALLYSQNQVKAIGPLSAHAVRILWLAAAWTAIQFMIGIVGMGGIGRIAIGAPKIGSESCRERVCQYV